MNFVFVLDFEKDVVFDDVFVEEVVGIGHFAVILVMQVVLHCFGTTYLLYAFITLLLINTYLEVIVVFG